MSDPSYPAAAAARPRPSSVTISSYLLILYAVLQVIGLILSLTTLSATRDAYRDLYAGTSAEGTETIAAAGGIAGAVVGLVLAAGFVVLALLNNRGKNVSRIVTWVICGIAICCAGVGLAGTALTESISTGSAGGDMPSTAEVQQRLDEALPSWYTPVTLTLSVIGMVALIGAVILLALPASNAFFRKPPAGGWEPPLPGAAYPAYPPAYPNAGYPSTTAPAYPSAPPVQPDNPYAPPAPTADPGPPSGPPSHPTPPSHHGSSSHHGSFHHGSSSDSGPSSHPGPSSDPSPSSDPGSSTSSSDSGSSSSD